MKAHLFTSVTCTSLLTLVVMAALAADSIAKDTHHKDNVTTSSENMKSMHADMNSLSYKKVQVQGTRT